MHIAQFDQTSRNQLENIIKPHSFLELTDSKSYYPQSQGSGLPLLLVNTSLCTAVISLQGAHLLEFSEKKGDPLLWLSPNCNFTPGTALRGGVPICLPWFGPHPNDKQKPKHGFARNQFWQLSEVHQSSDVEVELEFLFVSEANELFPYDFSAELRMTLGKSAKISLTINNTDTEAFDLSWALHHYYKVSNIEGTQVSGLADRDYLDNLAGLSTKHQNGNLVVHAALDRVYPDVDNLLAIAPPSTQANQILIEHENCPSVIVWNPGAETAANIADIGKDQHSTFICVERGAVLNEKWRIEAGTSVSATVSFRSQADNEV